MMLLPWFYGLLGWALLEWLRDNMGRPAMWAAGIGIIGACFLMMEDA